jgi:membrane-bound inhibitor of C-type lysozyme
MTPRLGPVAIALLLLPSCSATPDTDGPAPAISRTAYACNGDPAGEILATVYKTEPPTARIERGTETATVRQVRAASGAKFEAPGVVFWTKGREALVTWHGIALRCTAK